MLMNILQNTLRSVSHPAGQLSQLVQQSCRTISTTSALYAEPPKKKRRIDPAVFKVRVERKIKKVEREIAKLESEPRQLAPILEYQLTNSDIRDLKARPKHKFEDFNLTEGHIRAAKRLWTFYRRQETLMERRSLAKVEKAQTRALDQLKSIDEELYNDTVAIDDTILIPYRSSQMRKETGPSASYTAPDGYVKDTTKEWVM